MTLWEYNKEIAEAVAAATDEDGVIDEEKLKIDLDKLEQGRAEKIDNCIQYYKNRKALADALKQEKQALEKRQRTAENEAERMKNYLYIALNGSKWESIYGKISYRTSRAVNIEDPALLPPQYIRTEIKPDKVSIKEALEAGATLEGASLEERTSTIIK